MTVSVLNASLLCVHFLRLACSVEKYVHVDETLDTVHSVHILPQPQTHCRHHHRYQRTIDSG